MLRLGMEVVPMILIGLVPAAVVATAFGVVVVGVQLTDRRMALRNPSRHSRADAFTRKVLGVYVRQSLRGGTGEHDTTDPWQTRR
jgi:hypothetical protein